MPDPTLEEISLRIFQALADLVVALEGDTPERGRPIPPETDELGAQAARNWLRTGHLPTTQEAIFAVIPRFWFANTFLQNLLVHRTQREIPVGRPIEMPAILMLDVWAKSGRHYWESTEQKIPWGG